MNMLKIMGIVLVAVGILGLVYGGFSYTKDTHEATIGAIELSVKEQERVTIPIWAGVGAIALGSVLLLFGTKKS